MEDRRLVFTKTVRTADTEAETESLEEEPVGQEACVSTGTSEV